MPGPSSETHGCEGSRLCLRGQISVLAAHVLVAYTDPPSAHVPSYCWHSGGPCRLGLCVQFEGSRSAQEIQKFWQNWEHPSINKQEWSGQEVSQLKAIAAKHGHLEWQKVAEELGVRTGASGTGGQRVWGSSRAASPHSSGCPSELLHVFILLLSRVWSSGSVTLPHLPGLSLQKLRTPETPLPLQELLCRPCTS